MKTYNITYLSIMTLFLQIGMLHADPFNIKTDRGLQCTVSAGETLSLHRVKKSCWDCILAKAPEGAIELSDQMFHNRVELTYDDTKHTYTTSFGPAMIVNGRDPATYDSVIPGQLSVLHSVLAPHITKDIPISDSLAVMLQGVEDKKDLFFAFGYRSDGRWDITGIFDPEEAGGELSGVFLDTGDTGVDCKAIKKSTRDKHVEDEHTEDKTPAPKDKSAGGNH